ncbi:MAG TPA: hypothetical protein VMV21_05135 [Vicinamibacteria bacterium]|nr:hypothetical protein [Vicinamibacteria bacterium]
MSPRPEAGVHPGSDDDGDDEGGFDFGLVVDYLAYTRRALRRRWLLGLGLFVAVVAVGVAVVALLPRTYHVQTRILAQRNQVIATLGNPNRTLPSEADSPTRGASEAVLRHDSILTLIRQTNLVEQWQGSRTTAGRFKDSLRRLLKRPEPTRQDIEDALATMLKKRLTVWTATEGTVTISVEWADPEMAFKLVEAAQENFLESRHQAEISVIAESISMLEEHASSVRENVDVALADYRVRRTKGRASDAAETGPAPAPPAAAVLPDAETAQLALRVTGKRRAVKELEDYRQRRLGELQAQLAEQRAVYADSHPNVVNLRQSIDAISRDSASLVAARKEQEDLEAEYVRRAGHPLEAETTPVSSPLRLTPIEPLKVALDPSAKVEPGEEYARQRMTAAVNRYNTLLERVDAAHMELDAARAAFKYRYVVTEPPRAPKDPSTPNVMLLVAAATAAGLALAVIGCILAELRTGLLVQPWQVERSLGLPLLADASRAS